jgi:hypothetical protein
MKRKLLTDQGTAEQQPKKDRRIQGEERREGLKKQSDGPMPDFHMAVDNLPPARFTLFLTTHNQRLT